MQRSFFEKKERSDKKRAFNERLKSLRKRFKRAFKRALKEALKEP
jgi:hypothetical protein